jgi:hypothetical protein
MQLESRRKAFSGAKRFQAQSVFRRKAFSRAVGDMNASGNGSDHACEYSAGKQTCRPGWSEDLYFDFELDLEGDRDRDRDFDLDLEGERDRDLDFDLEGDRDRDFDLV